MSAEVQTQLEAFCQQMLPGLQQARVERLTQMNAGWESILYAFDLLPDPQQIRHPRPMVLRIYPGTDARSKSLREFTGLRALARAGYPVPRVDHLERQNSPFKHPFLLMERIPGEALWPVLSRSQPQTAQALLEKFTALLFRLHSLHWAPFVPLAEQAAYADPYDCVDRWLAEIRSYTDQFPAMMAFEPVVDWLTARRNQVPCQTPAPVHWDFHPGNLILRPDGGLVVIDWTQIQISDPRFDLSWTLLLAGIYEGQPVRQMILQHYERLRGAPVPDLAFFDVANCLKRLGSVMLSLAVGADQMGMRPDAVANMRADLPALRRVYALLQSHSGLQLAQVESFLNSTA